MLSCLGLEDFACPFTTQIVTTQIVANQTITNQTITTPFNVAELWPEDSGRCSGYR